MLDGIDPLRTGEPPLRLDQPGHSDDVVIADARRRPAALAALRRPLPQPITSYSAVGEDTLMIRSNHTTRGGRRSQRLLVLTTAMLVAAGVLSACGAGGVGSTGDDGQVTLKMVAINLAQIEDLTKLTAEFEKGHPNIQIDIVQMEEVDLRDTLTKDIASGSGQWDIATVGALEVPLWAKNDWLVGLTPLAEETEGYDVDDIIKPVREMLSVDGQLYGIPLFGEGVFTMYNKELFEKAGLTMPENPTWPEIADLAARLDTDDQAGVCMRGKAAWGDLLAQMANVIHAYGGNFYDERWHQTLDSPESLAGIEFYINLLKEHGQPDPAAAGFPECFNLFAHGKAAIWVDATSAAGSLESAELSDVAGKVGYVPAPTNLPGATPSIWSWNLAIPATSTQQQEAWEFISWATSKEYVKLAGDTVGWTRIPAGSRASTYDLPEYQQAASAFADQTLAAMESANPTQPGVNPQPYVSTNFVAVPEWQDTGNRVAQYLAEALAGRDTIESAVQKSALLLEETGVAQK
ncbi:ABC transporter substrate-binding protein [Pseudonocardia sp. MH-G8]|uniref:ABC transporter substrate-binding protein n=1 Tax=Pseudonocardia sp. MH-G8 TaxID=1854588 RepID=UPI000BA09B26|nr:sugar ABC transporter substrate-binding protein [Pseudonocardia sp. MH-G8]OZM77990.1 sugar ABC transporter substrate-binding protein [Pseudonocardia sp. MH-G8]